jgi:hypothetical protein
MHQCVARVSSCLWTVMLGHMKECCARTCPLPVDNPPGLPLDRRPLVCCRVRLARPIAPPERSASRPDACGGMPTLPKHSFPWPAAVALGGAARGLPYSQVLLSPQNPKNPKTLCFTRAYVVLSKTQVGMCVCTKLWIPFGRPKSIPKNKKGSWPTNVLNGKIKKEKPAKLSSA